MTDPISNDILDHLTPLTLAADELANTWSPDDPAYRAELYRQALMNLSYGYFAYFYATPEHPDWAPLWNPVYTLQPNPDDIYLYSPIRGDLSYRVSGNRGTIHILSFTSQHGMSGMVDDQQEIWGHNGIDDDDIAYEPNGDFEILFSAERPAGHSGNWAPIDREATGMFVRFRSYDWSNETDPVISIECLDEVPPKPRLRPEEIAGRIEGMARLPVRKTRLYFPMQDKVKDAVGFNRFLPQKMDGALTKQTYLPAFFQLEEDEALIIETEIPRQVRYWNFQLNDPLFNALEYVYRLSSTNGAMATLSSDGKFRAVIALTDPGVPNWLDPAGFTEGGIYGRWYEADSVPTPEIKRVKLAELRTHIPPDTPVVTPSQRREELARRVRACQRRRRW
ncbi:DUF1214 domain-containing protein [Novosphingobium beihaiensis]|uniref:DUF1214 domain-containing protein n=1 Tax=Novosphingobium beihaiensis TaxID=2930389 RepID=A0ABT0BVW7_9SPHN|nr:DUF1214 domain-containing protein [Novosphingobium beihaiensis]MCJ2189018.1 DUF1214 domain-containing protein [Novosphingobium beihaiensis]